MIEWYLRSGNIVRKIADVAEKYKAKALKLTSAQRIAIVGLEEKDLDNAWADLGLKPGVAIGLCVRSIKFCPGTTFCKRGKMDLVGMGMQLDEKYHGMTLPSKFKIGVSGCQVSFFMLLFNFGNFLKYSCNHVKTFLKGCLSRFLLKF